MFPVTLLSAHLGGRNGFGSNQSAAGSRLWRDVSTRPLVAAAVGRLSCPHHIYRVCHLVGISGQPLHLRSVPVAVLFAGNLWRLGACLVPGADLVAGLAGVLPGSVDPGRAGRLPPDLLLLSRRVLQSVLGRPAVVRGRRTAQGLLGRAPTAPDPAKHPPLFPVSRARL